MSGAISFRRGATKRVSIELWQGKPNVSPRLVPDAVRIGDHNLPSIPAILPKAGTDGEIYFTREISEACDPGKSYWFELAFDVGQDTEIIVYPVEIT